VDRPGDQELPQERRIAWERTYRMVPSRYPPIDLFERIGDPADWETLAALEGLTNDRIRDRLGDISAVPPEERISGPGASPIMAAFTHTGFPSRFTDGSYGVYYASERIEGALREIIYHQERFLRRTREGRARLEMRTYVGRAKNRFHDVRGAWPEVHDPDRYDAAQALGRAVRARGGNGIVYCNVRLAGVANLAVFRPKAVASTTRAPHLTQGPHFFLSWNGARIDRYIEVGKANWQEIGDLPGFASCKNVGKITMCGRR
jgi:RES domain